MSFDVPPVFSFLPNWAGGVLERIEYLTEIFSSETDEEQRRSMRRFPRRSIEAQFLRANNQRAALATWLAGVGRRVCRVPLWFEQYRPEGGLSVGQTQIDVEDLALREFTDSSYPEGGEILVIDRHPGLWEVATIASRIGGASRIILAEGLTRDWSPGVRIVPLRRARVLDVAQVGNVTDRVATAAIRFSLVDPSTFWTPAWGRCSPLFWFPVNRADEIATDLEWPAATITDNETGRIQVDDEVGQFRVATRVQMHLKGRARLVAYRRFLAAARGRCVRFWQPSLTADLFPAGPIPGGDHFDALSTAFDQMFPVPQDARKMVAFTFRDRRPEVYREVVSVAPVLAGDEVVAERFFTDLPTPPIQVQALDRIQFVVPARFDQDSFEIQHDTDGFARATAVMRSQSIALMPPIDCWVTSQVYPIETGERLVMAQPTIGNGAFFDPRIREMLDAEQPTIGDGTLRDLLVEYQDAAPDSLEGEQPTIGDGTLRALLISYTIPDSDAIDSEQPTIGDGELRVALTTYDEYPPEGLDVSQPTIGDGTLT